MNRKALLISLTILAVALVSVLVFSPAKKYTAQEVQALPDTAASIVPPAPTYIPLASIDVPILVYHNIREYQPTDGIFDRDYIVPPEEFTKQMQYLHDEGYTTLRVSDLELILAGIQPLPEKAVVLTFDDGRVGHYTDVWPILQSYGFRATFYVFTHAIDVNKNYLSSDMIRALDLAGNEIGSHTITHAYLTRAEPAMLAKELIDSKAKLESVLGHKVTSLAYPFGLYNDDVTLQTKLAGYTNARTLLHERTETQETLLTLPGFIVTGNYFYFLWILGN